MASTISKSPRSEASKRQRAAYARMMRERYRAAGLCYVCGMETVAAFKKCARCRRIANLATHRWWYRHRAANRARMRDRAKLYRARLKPAA